MECRPDPRLPLASLPERTRKVAPGHRGRSSRLSPRRMRGQRNRSSCDILWRGGSDRQSTRSVERRCQLQVERFGESRAEIAAHGEERSPSRDPLGSVRGRHFPRRAHRLRSGHGTKACWPELSTTGLSAAAPTNGWDGIGSSYPAMGKRGGAKLANRSNRPSPPSQTMPGDPA